jgi:hypothetical protein
MPMNSFDSHMYLCITNKEFWVGTIFHKVMWICYEAWDFFSNGGWAFVNFLPFSMEDPILYPALSTHDASLN